MEVSQSFRKFCDIINHNHILENNTALSVGIDLKYYLNHIKSDVLKELITIDNNNIYLEYLINEIERQNYIKQIDVEIIKKWLLNFDIEIKKILENKERDNPIYNLIDVDLDHFEKHTNDYKIAYQAQLDFVDFFSYYYANELIEFLKSKLTYSQLNNMPPNKSLPKPFKEEYLITFCESIDYQNIKEVGFTALYESIQHYTPYLESEILENITILPNDKVKDYLQFVIDKIQKTSYYNFNPDILSKWVTKYNLDLSKFPCYDNRELREILDDLYGDYEKTPAENQLILSIQSDFFCYAAMLEAKYMVNYVEELIEQRTPQSEILNNNSNKLKWIGKPSQLGFILAILVEQGYIEPPRKPSKDINYSAFARLVISTFNVDSTVNSLEKYLNIYSDKGQEPINKFRKAGFNIPDVGIVS